MKLFIILYILSNFIYQIFGDPVFINAIAFATNEDDQIYTDIINDFNRYSNEHKLNVKVNLNLLSNKNSTSPVSDHESTIEAALKKKTKNRYDIIFYNNLYTPRHGPYLYDLKKALSDSHIKMFDQKVIQESCIYKKAIVGLPISLKYTALYSNMELLSKYRREIPKTWDELMEISKYIVEEEKKNNNTNIMGYNGLFNEGEMGMSSIYEFIYSCRDSVESPFPELTSKTAVNSLKLMKKLGSEISPNVIKNSKERTTLERLNDGNAVFLKYWLYNSPNINEIYRRSILPGIKKGVSGSIQVGYNVGIDKSIPKEKLKPALQVVSYITSKEVQKRYFKNGRLVSAITGFYEDDKLCQIFDCNVMKQLQPIAQTSDITIISFEKYYDLFLDEINKYLDGFVDAKKALTTVENLAYIHYVSLNFHKSVLGFSITVVVIIIAILMALSLFFVHKKSHISYFEFLPKDFWYLIIIGLILILLLCEIKLGQVTNLKCHLYVDFMTIGFSLNFIPILHRLIVNFPKSNKFITWVSENRRKFFMLVFSVNILLLILLFTSQYKIKVIIIPDGESFNKCKMNNHFGALITLMLLAYNAGILGVVLLLIFLEWNITYTKLDIRLIISAIYIDIICIIILFLLHFVTITSYLFYILIRLSVILIIAVSNYVLFYGIRILSPYIFSKRDTIVRSYKSLNEKSSYFASTTEGDNATTSNNSSLVNKALLYHYKTSSSDSISAMA